MMSTVAGNERRFRTSTLRSRMDSSARIDRHCKVSTKRSKWQIQNVRLRSRPAADGRKSNEHHQQENIRLMEFIEKPGTKSNVNANQ
jgi:hypothetical protein